MLVYYLQGVLAYGPLVSGAALIPMALGMAVMAPGSSRLAERFGAKAVVGTGFGLLTAAVCGFQLLDETSSLVPLLAILSVQGLGMGMVMAPTTESIMSVVPRHKAGAGAAVNNSVRQVGGALGVAILGSLLANAYAARLGDTFDALPADLRGQASTSLVTTLAAVRQTVAGGDLEAASAAAGLIDPAREAFAAAMHLTALGTALATALAAVVVLVWLPGRRARSGTGAAVAG